MRKAKKSGKVQTREVRIQRERERKTAFRGAILSRGHIAREPRARVAARLKLLGAATTGTKAELLKQLLDPAGAAAAAPEVPRLPEGLSLSHVMSATLTKWLVRG